MKNGGTQMSQFQILIVEDEAPVRKWVHQCLERSDLDVDIMGCFSSGSEAAEAIRSASRIDLAILDIMIPGTDGLELLRLIKRDFPEAAIIMLTNFAEFEFIQRALREGAEEYFIKSEITEDRLISRVRVLLRKGKNRQALVQSNLSNFYQTVCKKVVTGEIPTREAFIDACRDFQPSPLLCHNLFVLSVCSEYELAANLALYEPAGLSLYLSLCIPVRIQEKHLTVLICEMRMLRSNMAVLNAIQEMTLQLQVVSPYLYLGISNVKNGQDLLYDAVMESQKAMWHGFYFEPGTVLFYYDLLTAQPPDATLSGSENLLLAQNLTPDAAQKQLDRIFAAFRSNKPDRAQTAYDRILDFLLFVRVALLHTQELSEQTQQLSASQIRQKLESCLTLHQLEEVSVSILADICSIAASRSKKYSEIVEKAIAYLDENVCRDYSLQAVAREIHVNNDYLGKLFKKETGKSFNSYATQRKMEYADYLLHHTDMKKYEVAERLSYGSYSHFSKLYKKYQIQHQSEQSQHLHGEASG